MIGEQVFSDCCCLQVSVGCSKKLYIYVLPECRMFFGNMQYVHMVVYLKEFLVLIYTKPVLGVFSEIQTVSERSVLPHMSVEFPILELEMLVPEVSMHLSKHNPFERKPCSMLSLLGFQMFPTAYMQQMLREILSVVPCHSLRQQILLTAFAGLSTH